MAKKILFIAPYPFDEAPSQRFRFEQYFEFLRSEDFTIEEIPFLDKKGWKALYRDGSYFKKGTAMVRAFLRRCSLMFKIHRYDHIFIHREASMIGPPFFEWTIAKVLRRKFIYDFDDSIWLPNYSEANARFHKLKMYKKVNKIMKWADKVVAGNTHLQNYALQFNSDVSVIPTTIDTIHVHNKVGNQDKTPLVIGWTGTHTTVNYLLPLLPILDKIFEQQQFELNIISNLPPEIDRPYVHYVKWNKETEITDLAAFNIGIMPMEESEWTLGKCAFKGLQYMALEIPAVISPVGMNKEILEHNVSGFLCSNDEEWHNVLIDLLQHADKRKEVGINGRKRIERDYSTTANSAKYLKLFQS